MNIINNYFLDPRYFNKIIPIYYIVTVCNAS